MKYLLSVEYQTKVTNCYDCPMLVRRQREFGSPQPQGTLTYVEKTTLAVAMCAITNEELNTIKTVGNKWDRCPLTVKEVAGE